MGEEAIAERWGQGGMRSSLRAKPRRRQARPAFVDFTPIRHASEGVGVRSRRCPQGVVEGSALAGVLFDAAWRLRG